MSDLAASTVRINDIETAQQAPNSEALQQKMGGAINGLLDRVDALETLRSDPGFLTTGTTAIGFFTSGTQTGIANFTFTGRPVMIVLYGGSVTNNGNSVSNTFNVSTTTSTLASLTVAGSSISRAFATDPIVTFLSSHAAGTYQVRYTATISSGSLAAMTITTVNIAIIEL